jgi:Ni2+-binding GTPase involved in maturation of urease and hydrogenase
MLKVVPIPVGSAAHPPPKHTMLPTHEFVFGVIAPPGSGKTNLLCNLLLAYKGYFHNIVIVSPSVNNGTIDSQEMRNGTTLNNKR